MKNRLFSFILIIEMVASCNRRPPGNLPRFSILLTDSTTVLNTSDIPLGKVSILFFFAPYCDYCQKETINLLKNIDSLKNVDFYFVTIEPLDDMRKFNKAYHLYKYSNITVGRDFKYFMPSHFKNLSPPNSFIFDENKRLRAVFNGQASARDFISIVSKL